MTILASPCVSTRMEPF